MSDSEEVSHVPQHEVLLRFLFSGCGHLRSDGTPRPEAFLPNKDLQLSVTRASSLAAGEEWQIGITSRDKMNENREGKGLDPVVLTARSSVLCSTFVDQDLSVIEKPLDYNVHHADVEGWPIEKAAQKVKAMQVASKVIDTTRP